MDNENQVRASPEIHTGIDQILTEGRGDDTGVQQPAAEAEQVAATQENDRDQSDATGPATETDAREKPESWTFKAMTAERKRRQALTERVKELQAENEALLASQSQSEQVDPVETQQWLDPLGTMSDRLIQQNGRVSRAEYIAENGKAAFEELDQVVGSAIRAGHPDTQLLSQQMRASDDPVGVMERWARDVLGYGVQATPSPQPVFPSNIAGARNVGRRIGPAWSGPPPLEDIFRRRAMK